MMALASASERTVPVASSLHRDVSERRRFDRPGQHGAAGRVGRELIEQPVARSAADNADVRVMAAGQLLERLEHDAILEREALENRARVAGLSGRLNLIRLPAVRGDGRRHVGRIEEAAVVRIEDGAERQPIVARGDQQIVVGHRMPGLGPAAHARLQQPEARDVLQQPRRTVDAAFVREIELAGSRRDHRARLLQRPAATRCPN